MNCFFSRKNLITLERQALNCVVAVGWEGLLLRIKRIKLSGTRGSCARHTSKAECTVAAFGK